MSRCERTNSIISRPIGMLILMAVLLAPAPTQLAAQSTTAPDTTGEAPRVALDAATGDERWTRVGAGVNGGVSALVVDGSGNLYAGGGFTTAGGVPANYIAKWNGTEWSALGSGMNGGVGDLAVDGSGNLYAAGGFTTAGGVAANGIAKWNGSEWSALGSGTNGGVGAIAVDGSGNLYATGYFTTAGGVTVNNIAKWNGSEWSDLGSGLSRWAEFYALAVDGSGNLYAAGSTYLSGVMKWDGSTWSILEPGLDMVEVYALVVDGSGNLYAGGQGDYRKTYVSKWNGSEWSHLPSGVEDYGDAVKALAVDGSGSLYAGGYFITAGGVGAYHIAKWDGNFWSALGSGLNDVAWAIAVDGSGNLYAGGSFTTAGGKFTPYIAKWGQTGLSKPTLAVDFLSHGLYLRDEKWKKISSHHPNLLAAWVDRLVANFPSLGLFLHDGTSWDRITPLATAESVIEIGGSLYVDFGTAIHRYNGRWSRIHDSSPTMMTSYGGKLVADFPDSGIWEYDGSSWKLLSTPIPTEQMVGIGTQLFVDFGPSGLYLYDGSWHDLCPDNPQQMHVCGTDLVASFKTAERTGLYLYRDSTWSKLSANPFIEGFASTSTALYVDFGAGGLYKYENNAWMRISSLNPDSIAIYGDKLVGDFNTRGLKAYSDTGWNSLSPFQDAGRMQGVVLFE